MIYYAPINIFNPCLNIVFFLIFIYFIFLKIYMFFLIYLLLFCVLIFLLILFFLMPKNIISVAMFYYIKSLYCRTSESMCWNRLYHKFKYQNKNFNDTTNSSDKFKNIINNIKRPSWCFTFLIWSNKLKTKK